MAVLSGVLPIPTQTGSSSLWIECLESGMGSTGDSETGKGYAVSIAGFFDYSHYRLHQPNTLLDNERKVKEDAISKYHFGIHHLFPAFRVRRK